MQAEFGLEFPLIEANAEDVPLPDASFDLVLSEYGASIWCDPYNWIPEAARLLRPGGRLVFLRNSTLVILCCPTDEGPRTTLQRPQFGTAPALSGPSEGHRVPPAARRVDPAAARERLRDRGAASSCRRRRRGGRPVLRLRDRRVGAAVAERGDLGRAQASDRSTAGPRVDVAATARDSRAARASRSRSSRPTTSRATATTRSSTRPGKGALGRRRRPAGARRRHRRRLRRRGARQAGRRERCRADARALSGRTHDVVSGLCLRTPAWEELHREVTRVTFRALTPRDIAALRRERRVGGAAPARTRSRASAGASSSGSRATTSTSSACPRRCSSACSQRFSGRTAWLA